MIMKYVCKLFNRFDNNPNIGGDMRQRQQQANEVQYHLRSICTRRFTFCSFFACCHFSRNKINSHTHAECERERELFRFSAININYTTYYYTLTTPMAQVFSIISYKTMNFKLTQRMSLLATVPEF